MHRLQRKKKRENKRGEIDLCGDSGNSSASDTRDWIRIPSEVYNSGLTSIIVLERCNLANIGPRLMKAPAIN